MHHVQHSGENCLECSIMINRRLYLAAAEVPSTGHRCQVQTQGLHALALAPE